MCRTCGCGGEDLAIVGEGEFAFVSGEAAGPVRAPWAIAPAATSRSRVVRRERSLLEKNDRFAAANRAELARGAVQALNLMSSPGSGKTSWLVRTIEALGGTRQVAVIEGDQETARDAERIRATGARALQINTGTGCHLEAQAVGRAIAALTLDRGTLLLIENVGNLVCPAGFDLGEAAKVVLLSVTEGEDKPLKYPHMFRAASLLLLNKCDLLPYLEFDAAFAEECARRVNPAIEVIRTSARTGAGLPEWLDWIERHRPADSVASRA